MKIELNLSLPKAPPQFRAGVGVVLVILLLISVVGIWSDFPWNGNPFVWIQAKECYVDGLQARARFALVTAATDFEKAVHIYPNDAHFQQALAEVLERQAKYEDAEQHYKQALKLRGNNVPAMLHLSTCQYLQSRRADATKTAQEALKIDPRNAEANVQLALLLLEDNKDAEAQKLFDAARNMDHDTARYWFLTGQYYRMQNKLQETEAAFRQAALMDHAEPEFAEWLGMQLFATGKTSEAQEWLGRATKIDTRCAQYFENYGIALQKNGNLDDACVMLEKAHLLDKENLLFAKRYIVALHQAKHYKLCESVLADMVKKYKDAELWDYYVDCMMQLRTFGDAERTLEKLSNEVEPSVRARTLCYLADLYNLQGKIQQARDTYKLALSANPGGGLKEHIEKKLAEDEKALGKKS